MAEFLTDDDEGWQESDEARFGKTTVEYKKPEKPEEPPPPSPPPKKPEEPPKSLADRLADLERLLANFNISTQDGITAHGSLDVGYAVDTSSVTGFGLSATGPPHGACCPAIGGPCYISQATECPGTYLGDGSSCLSVFCPGSGEGACCHGNACDIETATACAASGGVFHGYGVPCSMFTCGGGGITPPPPGTGACCDSLNNCTITRGEQCTGTYQGDGTTCGPDTCRPIEPDGACCDSPQSLCRITTLEDCGGIYFGDFIPCTVVGTCASAFCGPTDYLCVCPRIPAYPDIQPVAVCCPNDLPICKTMVSFGVPFCNCCRETPFGLVCLS